jgi:hypothetical protein
MTTHIAGIITVPIYSQLGGGGAPHILDFCTAVRIILKDSAGNGLWGELLHCDAIEKGVGVFTIGKVFTRQRHMLHIGDCPLRT